MYGKQLEKVAKVSRGGVLLLKKERVVLAVFNVPFESKIPGNKLRNIWI